MEWSFTYMSGHRLWYANAWSDELGFTIETFGHSSMEEVIEAIDKEEYA